MKGRFDMYDINGRTILGYDIGGNQFSTASMSGERPHNETSYSLSAQYGTNIDDSYAAFKASFAQHPTAIPFFLQSDQHGSGMQLTRYINYLDARDKLDLIKFQLGDWCSDTYSTGFMDMLQTQAKKVNGFVSVPGNHDYKGFDYSSASDHDLIKQSFTQDASWFGCKWLNTEFQCYTAVDVPRNLKMIVVDPYDQRGVLSSMPHPWYNSTVVSWLINELTNDSGFDLMYVQHEPIFDEYYTIENPDTPTQNAEGYAKDIRPLIVARKNKTAGSFTDKEGITHSYDFTHCEGDLLMSIHGHMHAELWDTHDFTEFTCPNGYAGTFGLIDRDANLLRVWVFSYNFIRPEHDIALI